MPKLLKKFYITRRLDNSISDEKNPTSIAKKKLLDAIEECKNPIKSINKVTDLDTQLSKEIDLFTSGGGRGEYLQAGYSWIYILPTSVDFERCFSTAPYVQFKIRSDNILDALIFRDFWIPNYPKIKKSRILGLLKINTIWHLYCPPL